MKGKIVKGIGGFYYVDTGNRVYQCRARGLFKKQGITPMVGDLVDMEETTEKEVEGYVTAILPRKNCFIRPPIANVDLLVVMAAVKSPAPHYRLIDRFLVMAEMSKVEIICCISKIDLAPQMAEDMMAIYGSLYPTYPISCKQGEGIEDMAKVMAGKNVALAGPSGVGKSTLLNHLRQEATAVTGEISKKTGRGRHTTRHVEIFSMEGGGSIFDTPGFTSFDILEAAEEDLAHYYPEMRPYLGLCRFDNCRHIKEPACRVRQAVIEGEIAASRYDSYITQMEEMKGRTTY